MGYESLYHSLQIWSAKTWFLSITPLALAGWEMIKADSVLSVSLAFSLPSHIQHTIKAALSNWVHCAVPGLKMAKLNDFRPSEDFILLLQTSAPSATGMNSNSKWGFDFLKRWTDNKKLKFNTAKFNYFGSVSNNIHNVSMDWKTFLYLFEAVGNYHPNKHVPTDICRGMKNNPMWNTTYTLTLNIIFFCPRNTKDYKKISVCLLIYVLTSQSSSALPPTPGKEV